MRNAASSKGTSGTEPTLAASQRARVSSTGDVLPVASDFLHLAALPYRELEREFLRGETPRVESLVGWEFRGLNRPVITRALGIRKFIKGFYLRDGKPWGYNCPVTQNGDNDEWSAKPSDDTPRRFGFYRVVNVDATAVDNKYLHALLLDYGLGENPKADPTRGLRDYLAQISEDVMLGVAYYAVAGARLRLPSYFLLSRYRRGLPPLTAVK